MLTIDEAQRGPRSRRTAQPKSARSKSRRRARRPAGKVALRAGLGLVLGLALCLLAPQARADVRKAKREADAAIAARNAPRLRRAIRAIAEAQGPQAVRAVLALAKSGRELDIHAALLAGLTAQTEPKAVRLLAKQARAHKDWTVRFLIVEALARMPQDVAREALFRAFSDKQAIVAAAAIRAAAEARSKEAIPEILGRLGQVERRPKGMERVRAACLQGLARVTGESFPGALEWSSWWKVHGDGFDPSTVLERPGGGTSVHTVVRRVQERGEQGFLEELTPRDIYVVTGASDKVESVLDHLKLPYTLVKRRDFGDKLSGIPTSAVLIFNCAGHKDPLSAEVLSGIGRFVAEGGYVFTSDWELELLARALPGYVGKARETAKHELPIRAGRRAVNHPYLRDVFPSSPYEQALFKWKIEGRSFLVRPLRKDVVALVECDELQRLYGSAIVACTFRYKRGAALHVLSHFEKQRDEKGDGFALQQILVNFVVEKRKALRRARRPR